MGRTLSLTFVMLLVARLAFAQGGAVCLFSDPSGTTCSMSDSEPGILEVYVVHSLTPGATGVQFAAPKPDCMVGASWVSDNQPLPVTIGDSQTGVSIGYGSCLASPIHLLTINYATAGTTLPDCPYPVLEHPGKTFLEVVDCAGHLLAGSGGTAYINSTIPCECEEVALPPLLEVVPLSLDFGTAAQTKSLTISNVGQGGLDWELSPTAPWISLDQTSGTNDAVVQVTVDRTGLAVGNHQAFVDVTSNGGNVQVLVKLTVAAPGPVLAVSPPSLDFGSSLTADSFQIVNVGSGTLDWNLIETASWLSVTPFSGSGDQLILVSVNRAGLDAGSYIAIIEVFSNGGNAIVEVTMTVSPPGPVLGFSPTGLAFQADVDSMPLDISNDGAGDLEWVISSSETWLSADPSSGVNDAVVQVSVDRTGLPDGTYGAELSILSNGGNGIVPVVMVVLTTPVLSVSPTLLLFSNTKTTGSFTIKNTGVGTLEWSLSDDAAWIEITSPLSGTGDATVSVAIDTSELPGPGQHTGHIQVTSNGGDAVVTARYNPPSPVVAGVLGLYMDPEGQDCDLIDAEEGPLMVYVVHTLTLGATGVQFSAPKPECMTEVTYLSDVPIYPIAIGNSQTGVAIGYGACLNGTIHAYGIQYFGRGMSETCCEYPVLPDPNVPEGEILVVDCNETLIFGTGRVSVVNPDDNCRCLGDLLPVEKSTWGRIKAIYAPEQGDANGPRKR